MTRRNVTRAVENPDHCVVVGRVRYYRVFIVRSRGRCAHASETISDALEPDSRDRVKVTFTRRRRLRVCPRARSGSRSRARARAPSEPSPPRQYLSVVTGRRSCQQAVFRDAVFEPIGEYNNNIMTVRYAARTT